MEILQELIRWLVHHAEALLLCAVGILELTILFKIPKEKKGRIELIGELRTTRVVLGREPYLNIIKRTLEESRVSVYFVSNSLTSNMSESDKSDIYRRYRTSIDHRCIAGKDAGKIKYMWEQRRKGVEVRVNNYVMISTFRFQVCDDDVAVLGLSQEDNEQSRQGILIGDRDFCRMLKDNFLRYWDESETLEEFTKDIALEAMKPNPSVTLLEELSQKWSLEETEKNEIKRLLKI